MLSNNNLIKHNASIGNYGSSWKITTSYKNIGSKLPAISDEYFKTTTGNDASITIKKSGLYLLLASSEFGAATGTGGTAWGAIMSDSDADIVRTCSYVYGGSATATIAYMLQVDESITLKFLSACSVGSGAIQNKGMDIFQCIKLK